MDILWGLTYVATPSVIPCNCAHVQGDGDERGTQRGLSGGRRVGGWAREQVGPPQPTQQGSAPTHAEHAASSPHPCHPNMPG